MQRGSKYLPMIQNVFRAEGLPLDLAYVPLVESAFKPNALSRAKAKGVWQFMRGTGARERPASRLVHRRALGSGKGHAGRGEVPADARQAVRRRLAPRARVLQRRPRPPAARDEERPARRFLGAGRRSRRLLPRETREYVPMILAAIVIARNPAQYGFDFEPEAAPSLRARHAAAAGRSAPRRRVGRHDDRRDSGAQSRAAPLDDARQRHAVRAEGAGRHERRRDGAAGRIRGRRARVAEVVHGQARRHARRSSRGSCASARPIWPRRTTCHRRRASRPVRS